MLVYKLDRFSRNKFESVVHKKTLKDNGVTVLSAMEAISDTPEGRMLETILEGFNQYYSEELTQKVNRGLRESWIKGNATGGKGCFGYKIVNKKYVIIEEEAEIVRYIFDKYAQGFQAKGITQELCEQGVRRQDGTPLNLPYVYMMLHNIRYTGKVCHRGEWYYNIYPRIISDEQWNRVTAVHEENKLVPGRRKEGFGYLLTGKLVCGLCKKKMTGMSGTSRTGEMYYYYRCTEKRYHKNTCKKEHVSKEFLEDLVINTTVKILKEDFNIMQIANKISNHHKKTTEENAVLNVLLQKKKEIQRVSANVMKAIEQGIINEQTKTRMAELEQELHQIDFDIDQEKQRIFAEISAEEIAMYLKSIIIENPDDMKMRKLIINNFVKCVILYDDKIKIVYNFMEAPTFKITNENVAEIESQLELNTSAGSSLIISSSLTEPFLPHKTSNEPFEVFVFGGPPPYTSIASISYN